MTAGDSQAQVQLLVFDGCPLADAARAALQAALAECGIAEFEEIDILDGATADDLRGWGSPTILVNGKDVTGQSKGDGVGCRIYAGAASVPERDIIAAAIRAAG